MCLILCWYIYYEESPRGDCRNVAVHVHLSHISDSETNTSQMCAHESLFQQPWSRLLTNRTIQLGTEYICLNSLLAVEGPQHSKVVPAREHMYRTSFSCFCSSFTYFWKIFTLKGITFSLFYRKEEQCADKMCGYRLHGRSGNLHQNWEGTRRVRCWGPCQQCRGVVWPPDVLWGSHRWKGNNTVRAWF